MRKKLETIEEMASVQEAAKKMKDKNVSSLVVIDAHGKPAGLVTERDIVRKVCVNDIPTSHVTSKEVMSSSPLITVNTSSSPSSAADMMLQYNVRHLLVIEGDEDKDNPNKPLGIITPLDFTRYQEYVGDEDKEAIEKVLQNYISSEAELEAKTDAFTGV
jgi:CBS domain-containing protein